MSDPMEEARAQAISEICGAMLKAAGEAMIRHGNDPLSHVIMTAATAMFIRKIDANIDPGFARVIAAMLKQP